MKYPQQHLVILALAASLLTACGEDNAGSMQKQSAATQTGTGSATTMSEPAPATAMDEPADTGSKASSESVSTTPTVMDNGVIYQEEIYKDWPYTEAPPADTVEEIVDTVTDKAEQAAEMVEDAGDRAGDMAESMQTAVTEKAGEAVETMESAVTGGGDKPYQVVDGQISENALEGWRTYNGGGCGTCHGKGGIGAVGPNLAVSVAEKISKEEFIDVVTNGRPGTMMRPHNTNKRVMDNLDALYAYLLARGDGVLGPGNLIKQPLGK